jgi:hypothetical protein
LGEDGGDREFGMHDGNFRKYYRNMLFEYW